MKRIFKTFIVLLFLSSSLVAKGTIILINGTSSAGKSSISRALQKALGESSWEIIDGDYLSENPELATTMRELILRFIETKLKIQLSPEEKQKIMSEDLFELDNEGFGLPAEKHEKLQAYMEDQAGPQIYKQAIRMSNAGRNVIVPSVFEKNMKDELDAFSAHDNVLMVLVFCSLTKIPQRISYRNEAALRPGATAEEKDDIRPVSGVLRQFSGFYPAGNRIDMPVLEELTLDQINEAWKFSANDVDLFKDQATEEKLKVYVKENYKEMMDNFGLKGDISSIEIRPRFYYDIIVNNGDCLAQECAQQIQQFMESGVPFTAMQKNVAAEKQIRWWPKLNSWLKRKFVAKNKTNSHWRKGKPFILRG